MVYSDTFIITDISTKAIISGSKYLLLSPYTTRDEQVTLEAAYVITLKKHEN
jgi:hypothetical protein